jgi:hypothetical protein
VKIKIRESDNFTMLRLNKSHLDIASRDWENKVTGANIHDFRNCYNNLRFYLDCYEFDLDTCDYTDLAKENTEYAIIRDKNILNEIKESLNKICKLTGQSYPLDFFLENF